MLKSHLCAWILTQFPNCSDDDPSVDMALRSIAPVSAAPAVDSTGLALVDGKAVPLSDALHLQPAAARSIQYNLPIEQMHAPVLGPAAPNSRGGLPVGMQNHWAGQVDDFHINSYVFEDQYHNFRAESASAKPAPKRQKTGKKSAQDQTFDPTIPFTLKSKQPWAEKQIEGPELTEEQRVVVQTIAAEKAEREAAAEGKGERSIFHGAAESDYQGRSWIEPPRDLRSSSDNCFLPKRHLHTWSGHTKGVNAIRLFPDTGHLLLSAGLDGAIKIWDVARDRKVMRTYLGHTKGVRDICFSRDGRNFVSTSYDKVIKYWDTETGTMIQSFGQGQMAYCVRIHPGEDKQNVVLAGMQNKKILQFDVNSGECVQEYDYHLGPVNSITFIDENRKFISTSDDKSIRVWEFGIPVQAKHIADPTMHAIAATASSPDGKWFIGQSMSNEILTYSATDRVRQNRKKTFRGHSVAGYACQPNFSPDGHYVISGDGDGKLFVWDWKTTRVVRSLKAHEGVCIGAEWHPLEPSKVVTCGWDGMIKLWD